MGKTFHCWRQYGHQSTSLQLTYNLQEQAPAKEENMALTNRTLILFKYFWEATDEAHPVSLADISAQLKEHGITADPRTLRSDIEQLVEFGVDIVKERRVQNLYHVATRHFEAPEVKLLIDAVAVCAVHHAGKKQGAGQTADDLCCSRRRRAAGKASVHRQPRKSCQRERLHQRRPHPDRHCRAKENRLPLL